MRIRFINCFFYNLPQWRSFVKLIRNGAGIISLKRFIGYVDENKKTPQYVRFRWG